MNDFPYRRLGTVAVLSVTTLALSACGVILDDDEITNPLGFENGASPADAAEGLSALEAIALFGVIPLLLLLVVAALVWLPGMVRGNRYRPTKGWTAAPLWFGGPPDPAAAVETAQTGELVRGGASGSW